MNEEQQELRKMYIQLAELRANVEGLEDRKVANFYHITESAKELMLAMKFMKFNYSLNIEYQSKEETILGEYSVIVRSLIEDILDFITKLSDTILSEDLTILDCLSKAAFHLDEELEKSIF